MTWDCSSGRIFTFLHGVFFGGVGYMELSVRSFRKVGFATYRSTCQLVVP